MLELLHGIKWWVMKSLEYQYFLPPEKKGNKITSSIPHLILSPSANILSQMKKPGYFLLSASWKRHKCAINLQKKAKVETHRLQWLSHRTTTVLHVTEKFQISTEVNNAINRIKTLIKLILLGNFTNAGPDPHRPRVNTHCLCHELPRYPFLFPMLLHLIVVRIPESCLSFWYFTGLPGCNHKCVQLSFL